MYQSLSRIVMLGACLAVLSYQETGAAAPANAPAAAARPPIATTPSPAPPPATAKPSAPSAAGSLPPLTPPLASAEVIQVLDQAVDWYRTLGTQQQAANEPSDLLFLYDNRQTASKVMGLAFDIARADADMLAKAPAATPDGGADAVVSAQNLVQLRNKFDGQQAAIQGELDAQHRLLAKSLGKSKVNVQAKLNELQGELDLVNTKKGILTTMSALTAGGSSSSGDLKAQIDAMAVAIPSAAASATTTATAAPATATSAAAPTALTFLGPASVQAAVNRFGLWDLVENAYRLSEKAGTVTSIDQRTSALQDSFSKIRASLLDQIKALSARGDQLAAQADSADSATLNVVHDQLDTLADQFKQASALLIPLSRESALLAQYRRTLSNWRDAIKLQYREALQTLGIRLGILIVALLVLFAAAELWRRLVLRYIQDSRRRYQLLLLRRIALWSLVVIVVGVAFASELGSIVTFAGLITAGIAVAMQSVLVSIVGYFFLIGKYGIRVGDRVQIGEVTGEVIDLGLVRMYLMELGAKGTAGPTGRVVAFANSVVFQVSSGLFKQIPGVNFSWREMVLTLPPGVDVAAVKERLVAVVTEALKDYHGEILRQTKEIARTTRSSSAGDAQPQVQLHFSATGVEAHVRYPVHLQHAAEIDERVSQALANVVSTAAAVPSPDIRSPPGENAILARFGAFGSFSRIRLRMILVIDVGNTRLKWAWLTSTGLSDQQAIVHREAKPGLWTAALFESGQKPTRVLVSNVAGPAMAKTLTQLAKKMFNVNVEFVTAAQEFHGLTNGYLDPTLLGADRWLALIGAWTLARSALCVVDAGTAVKVDSVDADGQHLGGLIAPGIHMMREVLMNKTSDIAKAVEHSTPSLAGVLANNTIGAVSRGAVFALAGMADRAAEIIEQSTGVKPKLFITGGDAGMITGTMRAHGEIVPDLVLQGLAVIAAQSG